MMKRKIWQTLGAVVLLCLLLTPVLAFGEARFPKDRGAVTDDADVLSPQMVEQIDTFQSTAKAHAGVGVKVTIVHFLDGLDAQTYASKLFARWGMGQDDFLLLGVVGEDSYAFASGETLREVFSDNNAQLMLSNSGFAQLFKNRQYDQAFGKFFAAFAKMLSKQYSTTGELGTPFSAYQQGAQATPKPAAMDSYESSYLYGEAIDDFDDIAMGYVDDHERQEREEGGLTPAGWVLLIILIGIVFSQSDPARKARKVMGCGCGPLGWLFGVFGLGSFLRKRR